MKYKGFVYVLAFALVLPFLSAQTTYTENTEQTCTDEVCLLTIYSTPVFRQDGGEWKTINDLTTTTWDNGGFNITYKSFWVHLRPFVVYNGQNRTVQQIKAAYPGVDLSERVKYGDFDTKFDITLLGIPAIARPNIDNIGFEFTTNIDYSHIERTGYSYSFYDTVRINFNDLLLSGFTIDHFNREYMLIGNITAHIDGDGDLLLDPLIEYEYDNITDDSYIDEFVPANSYGSSTYVRASYDNVPNEYRMAPIFRWNLTNIPTGATILSAVINLTEELSINIGAANYMNLTPYYVYDNYTWDESTITYNTRPLPYDDYYYLHDEITLLDPAAFLATTFYNWTVNVTNLTQYAINENRPNVTIWLSPYNTTIKMESDDIYQFYSKEATNAEYRPRFNVLYAPLSLGEWYYNYTNSTPATVYGQSVNISLTLLANPQDTNTYITGLSKQFFYEGVNLTSSLTETHRGANTTGNYTFWTVYTPSTVGNNEFYWIINSTLSNGSVASINITGSHLHNNISLFNCTEGNESLIFYIYDENSPYDGLDARMEIDLFYYATGTAYNRTFNAELEGENHYTICIEPVNATLYTDAYIKYNTTNGFTHRYIWYNRSVTNTSANFSIYNFDTTAGVSDLKITARRENYQYYTNSVVSLQRYYPSEGVWRTVQMDETGDFGLSFFNILEEYTDYRLIFADIYGNVLKQTARSKFVCEAGVCDIVVIVDDTTGDGTITNINYNYTYNNATKTLTLDWSDTANLANTVRVQVTTAQANGTRTLCDGNYTADSGTVVCDLSTVSDSTVSVRISADDKPISTSYIDVAKQRLNQVIQANDGALLAAFIALIVAAAGVVISPVAGMVGLFIGLLIIFFLGIFSPLTLSMLVLSAVIGVTVGVKVER